MIARAPYTRLIATDEGHTIEDFSFTLVNGWESAIVLPALEDDFFVIPAAVWCKRHGWENLEF